MSKTAFIRARVEPNLKTQRVFEETNRGIGVIACRNVDELFKELELSNAKRRYSKKTLSSQKNEAKI